MILLDDDRLEFRFPEHAAEAVLKVEFQRTLRIPDTDQTYHLPPGLGRFPLRHLDDHADRLPGEWRPRGGVMLPMWRAEALWVAFDQPDGYPFAVKVAAGKINAVTGEPWRGPLHRDPQDYLVRPGQPWLDGFCVEKGVIRQFVAMPLGQGYSAEEQVTGAAVWGGLQIAVTPIKAEAWARIVEERRRHDTVRVAVARATRARLPAEARPAAAMGLAPGGRMRQHIYPDPHRLEDWDQRATCRVFVTLLDALAWREVTGEAPPHRPPSARDYAKAKLPWFAWYADDENALLGSPVLRGLKSVAQLFRAKETTALPDAEDTDNPPPMRLGPDRARARPVREGTAM
jgi:hypothetical protein